VSVSVVREARNREFIHPYICQLQPPHQIVVRRQRLYFKVSNLIDRWPATGVRVVPANRIFMHCSLSSGVLASTTTSSWARASTSTEGMPPRCGSNRNHKESILDLDLLCEFRQSQNSKIRADVRKICSYILRFTRFPSRSGHAQNAMSTRRSISSRV